MCYNEGGNNFEVINLGQIFFLDVKNLACNRGCRLFISTISTYIKYKFKNQTGKKSLLKIQFSTKI